MADVANASGATPWGAIAGGIGGLISSITGAIQKRKGNKLLRQIGESPLEAIPTEILENQAQARINANQGLPSEQYAQAQKNIQRQQMLQLKGATDRRGGLLTLAANQDAANNALGDLDVANANARLRNQNTLYGINQNVAGWKDKVWQNNVKNVWDRKYNYAQSLLGSGNVNFGQGLDQLGSAAAMYGASGGFGNGGNRRRNSDGSWTPVREGFDASGRATGVF